MHFRPSPVRAPELIGRGGWVNTGGRQLSLQELRGRVVLLDFWTSACVNCMHVMEELRELEERYDPDQLTIIGVHSPKFEHETDHDAVVAATERHGLDHAVLDDPDMATWRAYGIRAWPTLVVIDQEGYVKYVAAGERQLPALIKVIDHLLASQRHHAQDHESARGQASAGAALDIRYPSKVAQMADGTFLLANTGNHNILQISTDHTKIIRAIGSGKRGAKDGALEEAQFSEPTAALVLRDDLAAKLPYDIIVADRGNHALRSVSMRTGEVRTLATGVMSPWDIEYWPAIDRLVIAVAGRHYLAAMDLQSGNISVLAGSGREGIRDGRPDQAEFAQTSGLAAEPGPTGSLWIIDAETSALRRAWTDGKNVRVETAIGSGLFDFGHKDGPARGALLQHPQGLSLDQRGNVLIADTFNGAVRLYVPATAQVSTIADGLKEPTDLLPVGTGALVVESAASRLVMVDLEKAHESAPRQAAVPVQDVRTEVASAVALKIVLDLPEPMHVDDSADAPSRLTITSTPPSLIKAGGGASDDLTARLELDETVESGTLHVSAVVAACDDTQGVCTVISQDWNLHVTVKAGGAKEVKVILSGPPLDDDPI